MSAVTGQSKLIASNEKVEYAKPIKGGLAIAANHRETPKGVSWNATSVPSNHHFKWQQLLCAA